MVGDRAKRRAQPKFLERGCERHNSLFREPKLGKLKDGMDANGQIHSGSPLVKLFRKIIHDLLLSIARKG